MIGCIENAMTFASREKIILRLLKLPGSTKPLLQLYFFVEKLAYARHSSNTTIKMRKWPTLSSKNSRPFYEKTCANPSHLFIVSEKKLKKTLSIS